MKILTIFFCLLCAPIWISQSLQSSTKAGCKVDFIITASYYIFAKLFHCPRKRLEGREASHCSKQIQRVKIQQQSLYKYLFQLSPDNKRNAGRYIRNIKLKWKVILSTIYVDRDLPILQYLRIFIWRYVSKHRRW